MEDHAQRVRNLENVDLMKNMLTHHAIGPVCRTDTG
jgi:hypothetical protein